MSISFSGIASGLDTTSWVKSLTQLRQAKVVKLEEQKQDIVTAQSTLQSIRSIFASFRSSLEKITDSKFKVSTSDIFAKKLAAVSNAAILSATAKSTAAEGSYEVKVQNTATQTKVKSGYRYKTTLVSTTQATTSSSLSNVGIGYGTNPETGITAGDIEIDHDDVTSRISISENETMSSFLEKLHNAGINANFDNSTGIFSIDVNVGDIRDIGNTNILNKLKISDINYGYTGDQLKIEDSHEEYHQAELTTLLSDLGVSVGTISISTANGDYEVTLDENDTIGSLVNALRSEGIEATFNDGIFSITNAYISDDGTTGLIEHFGLSTPEIASQTQISGGLKYQTVYSETTTAHLDSLLKDIDGVTLEGDQTIKIKDAEGNLSTVTVGTTTTIGDMVDMMNDAGMTVSYNESTGILGIEDGWIVSGGTFDVESAFGLQYTGVPATVTGSVLTVTTTTVTGATSSTKLKDLSTAVTSGTIKVTDTTDTVHNLVINENSTIGELVSQIRGIGLGADFDNTTGVLTLTGGSYTTDGVAVEDASNFLNVFFGSDTLAPNAIDSAVSTSQSLRENIITTHAAQGTTTLDQLGMTNGTYTATFSTGVTQAEVEINENMTMSGLVSALRTAGIDASFDASNSKLVLNDAEFVGVNGGNFDTIMNFTETITGRYVTSDGVTSQTVTIGKEMTSAGIVQHTIYSTATITTTVSQTTAMETTSGILTYQSVVTTQTAGTEGLQIIGEAIEYDVITTVPTVQTTGTLTYETVINTPGTTTTVGQTVTGSTIYAYSTTAAEQTSTLSYVTIESSGGEMTTVGQSTSSSVIYTNVTTGIEQTNTLTYVLTEGSGGITTVGISGSQSTSPLIYSQEVVYETAGFVTTSAPLVGVSSTLLTTSTNASPGLALNYGETTALVKSTQSLTTYLNSSDKIGTLVQNNFNTAHQAATGAIILSNGETYAFAESSTSFSDVRDWLVSQGVLEVVDAGTNVYQTSSSGPAIECMSAGLSTLLFGEEYYSLKNQTYACVNEDPITVSVNLNSCVSADIAAASGLGEIANLASYNGYSSYKYTITSSSDLNAFAAFMNTTLVDTTNLTVIIDSANDLTLNSTINNFRGTLLMAQTGGEIKLDSAPMFGTLNGATVKGVKIKDSDVTGNLFAQTITNNATVSGLEIENCTATGALVAGMLEGSSTIDNIHVSDSTVDTQANYEGLLFNTIRTGATVEDVLVEDSGISSTVSNARTSGFANDITSATVNNVKMSGISANETGFASLIEENSNVSNVSLTNANIEGPGVVAFVGEVYTHSSLDNIFVEANIISHRPTASGVSCLIGGFAGGIYDASSVSNVTVNIDVRAELKTEVMAFSASATNDVVIQQCQVYGNIVSEDTIGRGIWLMNGGQYIDCTFDVNCIATNYSKVYNHTGETIFDNVNVNAVLVGKNSSGVSSSGDIVDSSCSFNVTTYTPSNISGSVFANSTEGTYNIGITNRAADGDWLLSEINSNYDPTGEIITLTNGESLTIGAATTLDDLHDFLTDNGLSVTNQFAITSGTNAIESSSGTNWMNALGLSQNETTVPYAGEIGLNTQMANVIGGSGEMILSNGSTITVSSSDTLGDTLDALHDAGVTASYNSTTHQLSINSYNPNGVSVTSVTGCFTRIFPSINTMNNVTVTVTQTATESTTMAQLGMTGSTGTIVTDQGTITINSTDTIAEVMDKISMPEWATSVRANAGTIDGVSLADLAAANNGFIAEVDIDEAQVTVTDAASLASAISTYNTIGIGSAEALAALATIVNSGTTCYGKTIVLTADIDISSVCAANTNGAGIGGWTVIGDASTMNSNFNGTFNGNGHTITGLYINRTALSTGSQGLFGEVGDSCTIKNVGLEDVDITGYSRVGGLVGDQYSSYRTNNDLISNCYVTGTVAASDTYVGGLVGFSNGNNAIVNSYSECTVSGSSHVGGAAGYINKMENCYATGDVTSSGGYAGGLVGFADTNTFGYGINVTNCYAEGDVTASGGTTGGLLGNCSTGTVAGCYAAGNVTSTSGTSVGGLIGSASQNGTITNCYTSGDVNAAGGAVGGLVGGCLKYVENCFAEGDVTGQNSVGGLIGQYDAMSPVAGCNNVMASGTVIGTTANRIANLIGNVVTSRTGSSYSTLNITNATVAGDGVMIGAENNGIYTSGQMDTWLENIDVSAFSASFENGQLSITPSEGHYIYSMSGNIATTFTGIQAGNGYTYNLESGSGGPVTQTTVTASGSTTMAELGLNQDGTIVNNLGNTITIQTTDTVDSVVSKINSLGVTASFTNGALTVGNASDANYITDVSYRISAVLGIEEGENDSFSVQTGVTATESMTLAQLGMQGSTGTIVTNQGTVTVNSTDTIEALMWKLRGATIIEETYTTSATAGTINGITLEQCAATNNGFISEVNMDTPEITVVNAADLADAIANYTTIGIGSSEALAELAKIVNGTDGYTANSCLNKTIVLTTDLDLTSICAANTDGEGIGGWTAIGLDDKHFYGTFNGNGHKITGLYINNPRRDISLFYSNSGTIKNLGVEDVNITGCVCAGLVCYLELGTVSNCYTTGNITPASGIGAGGGLVAFANGNSYTRSAITDSYSLCEITGDYMSGLVAAAVQTNITNCYAGGNLYGTENSVLAGIAYASGCIITNCYYTGNIYSQSEDTSMTGCIMYDGGLENTITDCFSTGIVCYGGDDAFSASFEDGQLTITPSEGYYISSVSGNLSSVLGGIQAGNGYTYNVEGGSGGPVTQTTVTASGSTTMAELGLNQDGTIVNNLGNTITIQTTDTVDSVVSKINSLGVTASFTNGTLTVGNESDTNYITSVSARVGAVLGIDDGEGYSYNTGDSVTATESMTLAQLGMIGPTGTIVTDQGTITVSATDTIDELMWKLRGATIKEETYTTSATAGTINGITLEQCAATNNGFISEVNMDTPEITVVNAADLADAIANYTTIGIGSAEVLAELATIVNNGKNCAGKTFVLTNDIDISSICAANTNGAGEGGWISIGDRKDHRFAGNFDGQGHTISGLYINNSGGDDYGLFGYVGGYSNEYSQTISNVGLTDVDITAEGGTAGALVGKVYASNITKLYIDNCYTTGTVSGANVTGMVGNAYDSITPPKVYLSNSYSECDVTATNSAAGLLGIVSGSFAIENCYVTGDIYGTGVRGLLTQYTSSLSTIRNSYTTGDIHATSNTQSSACGLYKDITTRPVTTIDSFASGIVSYGGDDAFSASFDDGVLTITPDEGHYIKSVSSNLSAVLGVNAGYNESYSIDTEPPTSTTNIVTATKSTTFAQLGLTEDGEIITGDGHTITVRTTDSIADLLSSLYDVNNILSDFVDGQIIIGSGIHAQDPQDPQDPQNYIESMSQNLVDLFGFENNYTVNTVSTAATKDTLLSDLGLPSGTYAIEIGSSDPNAGSIVIIEPELSINDVCRALTRAGLQCDFNSDSNSINIRRNGDFWLNSMSPELESVLGISAGEGVSYNTIPEITETRTFTATTATTLSTLGLTSDGVIITEKGNITIRSNVTIGDLMSELSDNGISSQFSDGVLIIGDSSNDKNYIKSMSSNLIPVLGSISVGEGFSYEVGQGTETSTTVTSSLTSVTLSSTFGEIGITQESVLNLSNGETVTVDSDTTFSSFIGDMSDKGMNVSLVNGIFNIESGDPYITGYTGDNILNAMNIVGSTYQVTDLNLGNTKLKDLNDSLGNSLGITSGAITAYKNGIANNIYIDNNSTLDSLASQLANYNIQMIYGSGANGNIYFTSSGDSYLSSVAEGSNLLTALNIEDWVTVKDTESNSLSYTTGNDSVINADTKLINLKNSNGDSLGITTGKYKIVASGINYEGTITASTSVNDLFTDLARYGFSASINSDGQITLNTTNDDTYLVNSNGAEGYSNLVDTVFSSWTFGNIYTSGAMDVTETETLRVTRNTRLRDIDQGTYSASVIRIFNSPNNNPEGIINLSNIATVGDLMDELLMYGFNSSISNGIVSIRNDGYHYVRTAGNVFELLGIDISAWKEPGYYTGSAQTATTYNTVLEAATRSTTLANLRDAEGNALGITTGDYIIHSNGLAHTVTLSSTDITLDSFMNTLESYGINTIFDTQGGQSILKIVGGGDSYLESIDAPGASNVVEKLFTNAGPGTLYNYSAYEQTTELVSTTVVATLGTALSDYGNSEGVFALTVNGNYSEINITSYDTFGSLLEKFERAGVNASLTDGVLRLETGNRNFTVDTEHTTSNLLENLGLHFSDNLGGFAASSDSVTQTTTTIEDRTLSVAKYADYDTQMSLLNISSGTLSVYRNGEKKLINIDNTETFGEFRTRLQSAFADVDIDFNNGKLRFFSTTEGVDVQVGSSNDTSNISSICGFSQDENGYIVSARELYKVNASSLITGSDLFRYGDVTEGTFTIGDAVFTINDTTTIQNIIAQINSSEKANASAYWDSVDGKLVISARTTGASMVNIEAGTSNFTDILGLTNSEWNPDGSVNVTRIRLDSQEIGQNAKFTINGTNFQSASNVITSDVSRIQGLTLNLKSASMGETVTVTVGKDTEAVTEAVGQFVESYNELVENVDAELSQAGVLKDQNTLKFIKQQIRNLLVNSFAGATTFRNLAALGISTSAGNSVGIDTSTSGIEYLYFDSEKFMEGYNKDPDAVKNMLVGSDEVPGILIQIENIVENALATGTGYFSSADKSYTDKITSLNEKIRKANLAIEAYRARLESKFQSMDMLISQMQNQYNSFLSSGTGTGTGIGTTIR